MSRSHTTTNFFNFLYTERGSVNPHDYKSTIHNPHPSGETMKKRDFGSSWHIYIELGYTPIPAATDGKKNFLKGVIGDSGEVTIDKCRKWQNQYGDRNLGITGRLLGTSNESLLILDDDNDSSSVLESLEDQLGKLPPHPTNTARGATSSRRKHFFRVIGQTKMRGKLRNIDIVCWNQRHAVVEGIHPELKTPYLWFDSDGNQLEEPPSISDIPLIPEAWFDFWKQKQTTRATNHKTEKSGVTGDVELFLEWLSNNDLPPTQLMQGFIEQIESNPDFGNSELYEKFISLIELTNIWEKGGKVAFDVLAECWFGREHKSEDPVSEFRHNLSSALRDAWWPGPHDLPERTLSDVMQGLIDSWDAPSLEERVFIEGQERPLFAAIKKISKTTGDNPVALLMAVLLHVANTIPWDVYYKTPMGKDAINLCLVLLGRTGTGKSALMATAEDEFEYARDSSQWKGSLEAASGEGMQDAYYYRDVKVDRKGSRVISEGWRLPGRNPFFAIKEIGSLEARSGRNGSTYRENILDLYAGSEISRIKANGEGWAVPKLTYRWTCWIGAQPSRTTFMFNEDSIAAGLVGRFLWINVETDFEFDFFSPYDEAPFVIGRPNWEQMNPRYFVPTESLLREHEREVKKNKRGEGNPMESHTHRNKGRLACALAASDMRTHINDNDVEIAELLIQISRQSYLAALRDLRVAQAQAQAQKGKADGIRSHHGARKNSELEVQHHAKRIVQKLLALCGKDPATIQHLRQVFRVNFNSETRKYWPEAIESIAAMENLPQQLAGILDLEKIRIEEVLESGPFSKSEST
jgi:hypothetical protein